MYYVIFYDDWCSTVPKLWVDLKSNTFHWPPKEINATSAIIKNINPDDNWNIQVYRRIIGPYSNYYQFIVAYNINNMIYYYNNTVYYYNTFCVFI